MGSGEQNTKGAMAASCQNSTLLVYGALPKAKPSAALGDRRFIGYHQQTSDQRSAGIDLG
jgi:hypothetical protein